MKAFAEILLLGILAGSPLVATAAVQCSMPSGVTMAFGIYDDSSATAKDYSQSFTMSCCRTGSGSQNTVISIAIGKSLNSNQINTRQMKNGANADLMSYQLYYTSFGGTVWGDGVLGGSVFTQSVTTNRGCGNPQVVTISSPIYGRIFAQQPVSAGGYTDTLTITVSP